MSDNPANNARQNKLAGDEVFRPIAGATTRFPGKRNAALVYMRCFSILCIVLHHAMCVFGRWPPNSPWAGQGLPSWMWDICSLTKNWGLSSFSFMAGFCAVQSMKTHTRLSFTMRKIERLVLPCGFFGLLYWWMFPSMMLNNSPVNGSHLWYIPMLLLCFATLVITPSRLGTKVLSLGIIWGTLAIGNYYCSNHPACFDYAHQAFRPVREFVAYAPVFAFGFLWASLQQWCPRGRLWTSMALCIAGAFLVSEYPRSFLWYCIFQSKMIFWGGLVFSGFSFLASKWEPPPCLVSLDSCSFGTYVTHQFFLNAGLLVFGRFVFPWPLELLLIFCPAFLGGWLATSAWRRLSIMSRKQEAS